MRTRERQTRARRATWTLALVLVLLADGALAAEDESGWEFEFLPYAWLPGNFGTVTVRGRTAFVDVTVKDAIDLATAGNAFTAAGYFQASYDRWSVFVDAFGGYAEESVTEDVPIPFCTARIAATAEVRPVLVDFAVGYRLGQWAMAGRRRPLTLGVYAGTRYTHFGAEFKPSLSVNAVTRRSADVSRSFNWADPMIGVRWDVPVLDTFSLEFRGDIGGFGASSELIWGLLGGVRYWLPWRPYSIQPWLGAGYRAVVFDRDFGEDGNIDLAFRGPYAGLGLLF